MADWVPTISRGGQPLYLAIADALERDIDTAVLASGYRLPTQRALAEALNIDFTTVTRAYAEAGKRGLVEGRVGRGTYVVERPALRNSAAPNPGAASGLIDMAMNLPPRFSDASLEQELWDAVGDLGKSSGLDLLLRYQQAGGALPDRQAALKWLESRLPQAASERLLITPGTQAALLAIVTMLVSRDELIAVESLTYPGMKSLAAHSGRRLVPVAIDEHGLIPESFAETCRSTPPKVLYCTPTLHNPTTATLPLERREAIVEIARCHGVTILEDDAYGKLSGDALPPLAAIAPDITYHIAGLSKCLSPALRVAYVLLPDARAASRLAATLRATTSIASPLSAGVATRWIETGLADRVLGAIRDETQNRRRLAGEILGPFGLRSATNAFHAWLPLADGWTRGEFAARLRDIGIGVVTSDAFAAGPPGEGVRLSLGAAYDVATTERSLRSIADILSQTPDLTSLVV